MAQQQTPAVDLRRVFQHVQGRCVLQGLDLRIARGGAFLLLGANGAGKSLLLHLLAGLHAPSSGHVEVLGEDLPSLTGGRREALRRRLGMVFQDSTLLGDLSVLDNILLPLRRRRLDRDAMARRARLMMTRLHLDGLENAYPYGLPGGILRQIEMARALIHGPELLLCDEVLAGLDPDASRELLELLGNERQRRDMTIILTSHRYDLLHDLADQVGVLDGGRLRFVGSPAQLSQAATSDSGLAALMEPPP